MRREVRAILLEKFNEPLVLRSFPIQNPKEGEALVKVQAPGVCGSDVHQNIFF
jgi:D-arabinose 1-dehydrogenase-like Zn-dependent alcohol dehydrogenase